MVDLSEHDAAPTTEKLLALVNAGDADAREQLFQHCCDRLERLARKMLNGFPMVRRWEQTADVFQNAAMRLMRSLRDVKPESTRHFFSLAATQIRRELIDMARHYRGANRAVASLESQRPSTEDGEQPNYEPEDLTNIPDHLACWAELHRYIAELPDEEREVCELLWYQGMTQPAAAELLGVPLRTLKRRWQKIRLQLHEAMNGQFP